MRKVQLTLTNQEVEILSLKASQFGYNVTKYIKLLLGKEILAIFKKSQYPVFEMSKKAQKTAAQANKEYKKGKAVKISSVDDLDNFI